MVLVPRFSTTRRKGTVKVPLPLSLTTPLIRFETASEGAVVTGAESWQSGPTESCAPARAAGLQTEAPPAPLAQVSSVRLPAVPVAPVPVKKRVFGRPA